MKTRILIFFSAALLSSSCLFAQTTFGVRGGVNFYSLNYKDEGGDKSTSKLKTGFNIGVNAEIPVGVDFYLQPGLLFTTKGGNSKFNDDDKVSISYLEIPVNFIYKPELGSGRILLGFGPYVAFGVGGKVHLDGSDSDIGFTNEIQADDELRLYVKRMDAGANFLFGYEWANRFSVQLNAGLGLVNISPKVEGADIGETSTKNTGFGLSVGYRFGK